MIKTNNRLDGIGESLTNGAASKIDLQIPYQVIVGIKGVCPIIFHRWNCEAVEAKSKAKKGSVEKKTDDPETLIYRNENKELCIPGEYLRGSIINAAKFQQDPRSPRKSASDLFKAGITCLNEFASLGVQTWDYLDKRRVQIQRNGITRIRPAMHSGWTAEFELMVNLPEYIDEQLLNTVIQLAGRVIGLADFRPSYGRFNVTKFEVLK